MPEHRLFPWVCYGLLFFQCEKFSHGNLNFMQYYLRFASASSSGLPAAVLYLSSTALT